MRIWDQIEPQRMCRQHLLGEHRELHGLWKVLTQLRAGNESVGYAQHPETKRWVGHEAGLRKRHELLVEEMKLRNWKHNSPLPEISGESASKSSYPLPLDNQVRQLSAKACFCDLSAPADKNQ